MPNFNDFINIVLEEIKDLASESIKDYTDEAFSDGKDYLEKSKVKLEKWTKYLASGEIDKDEFTSLVKGQKDLAEMLSLKQAGLLAAKVDKFRNDMLNMVVNTALGMFL